MAAAAAGPFAAALKEVLRGNAEENRKDAFETGQVIDDNPLGCMQGSILVFRGALLPADTVA